MAYYASLDRKHIVKLLLSQSFKIPPCNTSLCDITEWRITLGLNTTIPAYFAHIVPTLN